MSEPLDEKITDALALALGQYVSTRGDFDQEFAQKLAGAVVRELEPFMRAIIHHTVRETAREVLRVTGHRPSQFYTSDRPDWR